VSRYFCCDERRREVARATAGVNGIDFLEVRDDPTLSDAARLEAQRVLEVHGLKPMTDLEAANVRIEGGDRIRDIQVVDATPTGDVLTVTVDRPGDFSRYTLRLVESETSRTPPDGFDPRLVAVEFSFKVLCPSPFDCQPERDCPPETAGEPRIDYLARDYASFRRLMLDRMNALLPQGQSDNAADMGVALVEMLAYVGDRLSYRQDAVATESYLHTARLRRSVRRHARLVDYRMHDGRNARAWVHVEVTADATLATGTPILTRIPGLPERVASADYAKALTRHPQVFETMEEGRLFPDHNQLSLYAWGDRACCLPTGATAATLRGHHPDLEPGMVLVFEEVLGPVTGLAADADPRHRHAVRLAAVSLGSDSLGGRLEDPPSDTPTEITEIAWAAADALPFAVCVSAQTEAGYREDVTHVLGNVVLADHGRTAAEELPPVPPPTLFYPTEPGADRCLPEAAAALPVRYAPLLSDGPLTQAGPYDPTAPAASAFVVPLDEVRPVITLDEHPAEPSGAPEEHEWDARRDLLGSDQFSREFVAEVEAGGATWLRFGDDTLGMRPAAGTSFTARMRLGNGIPGNVGAEALAHVVSDDAAVARVRNPMSAACALDPETIEEVRQNAPFAFRTQERAVTPEDWAEVARRHQDIQRAEATFRWTGSWYTVFLSVDRKGGLPVDPDFEEELRAFLERFRLAGYDLEIDGPHNVALELALRICVEPDYFAEDVERDLRRLFTRHVRSDGQPGLLHPDRFTFGQTVYLSPFLAAAQAVPGVASVEAITFQRREQPGRSGLETGRLPMHRLEVPRLDDDRNHPDRGTVTFEMRGGA